ncbi:penicillin acylase family protein [Euzebyella saccharophila]|uniref:Penicillin acylase family protein n=1 Tax=Euzebyella saccharophila TaxID=679664 RepID=A0ABV8JR81_9FLAO|nr:penicillin acylase family protein [Euzebyella saccharophila]
MKKFIWIFLGLIIFLLFAFLIFGYSLKPNYSGNQNLSGLSQEVTVHYDSYGIPHIYGANEKDAFKALGYVHAQDRLWQMELLRRIGSGGLSELFGKDLIGTDKFFLALGIDDASKEVVSQLNSQNIGVQLTQAYLDGINQFLDKGPTPIEFYLTGIEKRPFEIKDVYNIMGYMAFSFAMAHKTDPLLSEINNRLGPEYLKDLAVHSDTSTVWLQNNPHQSYDIASDNMTAKVFKSLKKLSIPLFEGSNSWVLGPKKTKNGKVIFANDPHIGFSQPSVWYEAHVVSPEYEKYGYHIAGLPFPLLGHDRNLAYGMTMFENDDVDFYKEKIHPTDSTKYLYKGSWQSFKRVKKSIKVKDSATIDFSYKVTKRGPILNGIADQIKGNESISMWWVYTQGENKIMDALYSLSHSNNIDDFRDGLKDIHAPGLNIMYGDAQDNVAWWASAQLYHIPDSVNTKMVYTGDNYLDDEKQYLDFNQNPQSENPPAGYVYSANNQPDSIAGMLYPGYYLPEDRARRITELLDAKNDWSAENVQTMINDVTSPVDKGILETLLGNLEISNLSEKQQKAINQLKEWDGTYDLNSTNAILYHRWTYNLLKAIFLDELGQDSFDGLMSTHLIKRSIAPLFSNPKSVWWDNIETEEKETAGQLINTAFEQSYRDLVETHGENIEEWTWDKFHLLEHGHPIGQVEALRSYFNVGPFAVKGSREVINNLFFPYTDEENYKISSGPSTRRIIDFSDIENSKSILPTGQSGNPLSEHYKDQAEMYINGEFRKMMMNKEEIETTSKSVLVLKPE